MVRIYGLCPRRLAKLDPPVLGLPGEHDPGRSVELRAIASQVSRPVMIYSENPSLSEYAYTV